MRSTRWKWPRGPHAPSMPHESRFFFLFIFYFSVEARRDPQHALLPAPARAAEDDDDVSGDETGSAAVALAPGAGEGGGGRRRDPRSIADFLGPVDYSHTLGARCSFRYR
ncbi:uncharacterized protein LOC109712188 [Ananas comosus]|uniref:Uncharacterized protein LOC109712188 n=1 Tax=Ananas comosus TaxID=4615 RepID=A0A6P5F5F1_ANACO|nr:uncharacterized protein LOC109712188 [Ananas comosus]